MAFLPFALPMPISTNFTANRMHIVPNGLVLHVTDGKHVGKAVRLPSLAGIQSTFDVPGTQVSAHFCVDKDGTIAQFVDTSDIAFAVGGDKQQDDDAFWYSIENIAAPGQRLTDEQIEGCAQIYAFFNINWGLPLRLAGSRFESGLGYHSMFRRAHPNCPGAAVIGQRQDILDKALDFGAS